MTRIRSCLGYTKFYGLIGVYRINITRLAGCLGQYSNL
jgi:hypothetical protein